MVTAAHARAIDYVFEQARAETRGPDDMYIPTTQIQIVPNGDWHRRSAIDEETACGERYAASFTREYELCGPLCSKCFSERERFLAEHPDELEYLGGNKKGY